MEAPDLELQQPKAAVPAGEIEEITDIATESKSAEAGDAGKSPPPDRPKKSYKRTRSILKNVDSYAVEERPASLFGGVIRYHALHGMICCMCIVG